MNVIADVIPEEVLLDNGGIQHIIQEWAKKKLGRKLTPMELVYAQEILWKNLDQQLDTIHEDIGNLSKCESIPAKSADMLNSPAFLFEDKSIIENSNALIIQEIGSKPNNIRRFTTCLYGGHKISDNTKEYMLSKRPKSIIVECDYCKLAIQVSSVSSSNSKYRYIVTEL